MSIERPAKRLGHRERSPFPGMPFHPRLRSAGNQWTDGCSEHPLGKFYRRVRFPNHVADTGFRAETRPTYVCCAFWFPIICNDFWRYNYDGNCVIPIKRCVLSERRHVIARRLRTKDYASDGDPRLSAGTSVRGPTRCANAVSQRFVRLG